MLLLDTEFENTEKLFKTSNCLLQAVESNSWFYKKCDLITRVFIVIKDILTSVCAENKLHFKNLIQGLYFLKLEIRYLWS